MGKNIVLIGVLIVAVVSYAITCFFSTRARSGLKGLCRWLCTRMPEWAKENIPTLARLSTSLMGFVSLTYFPLAVRHLGLKVNNKYPINRSDFPHWWVLSLSLAILFVVIFAAFLIDKVPALKVLSDVVSWLKLPSAPEVISFLSVWTILGLLLYGVTYNVLSYKQAERVQEKIRNTISDYVTFVRFLVEALEEESGRTEGRAIAVLWCPYFRITKEMKAVGTDLGVRFDRAIGHLIWEPTHEVTLVTAENPFAYVRNTVVEAADQQQILLRNGDTNVAFKADIERLTSASGIEQCAGMEISTQTVQSMVNRLKELLTPKVHENFVVYRMKQDEIKVTVLQLIWTPSRAAIVFVSDKPFQHTRSKAFGFSSEDPAMVSVVYEIAQSLIRGKTTMPRPSAEVAKLADRR
jgi:hypothetical protein